MKATVERVGWCTVVASEGVRNAAGQFLAEAGTRDAFGHAQLGGVAPVAASPTPATAPWPALRCRAWPLGT